MQAQQMDLTAKRRLSFKHAAVLVMLILADDKSFKAVAKHKRRHEQLVQDILRARDFQEAQNQGAVLKRQNARHSLLNIEFNASLTSDTGNRKSKPMQKVEARSEGFHARKSLLTFKSTEQTELEPFRSFHQSSGADGLLGAGKKQEVRHQRRNALPHDSMFAIPEGLLQAHTLDSVKPESSRDSVKPESSRDSVKPESSTTDSVSEARGSSIHQSALCEGGMTQAVERSQNNREMDESSQKRKVPADESSLASVTPRTFTSIPRDTNKVCPLPMLLPTKEYTNESWKDASTPDPTSTPRHRSELYRLPKLLAAKAKAVESPRESTDIMWWEMPAIDNRSPKENLGKARSPGSPGCLRTLGMDAVQKWRQLSGCPNKPVVVTCPVCNRRHYM